MLLCTKIGRKGNNLAISTHSQHMLKFSTQFPTYITVFNMCWNFQHSFFNMFSIHFKLENLKHLHSNCNWVHPENCVKFHLRTQHNSYTTLCIKVVKNMKSTVKIFKVCWKHISRCVRNKLKISRHVENLHDATMMSSWCDPFHQFWNIITVIKI